MSLTIIWIIAWALLLILEIFSPTFFLLFFSVGAICAALISWLGFDILWQLATFSIVSVLSLIVLRSKFKTIFKGRQDGKNLDQHPLLGQQGTVTKAIAANIVGEISVGGSFWKAIANENIEENVLVKVLGSLEEDALILKVERV